MRLRWEYNPGSEFFLVYTEDRDAAGTPSNQMSQLLNRGFVVKLNRLVRF